MKFYEMLMEVDVYYQGTFGVMCLIALILWGFAIALWIAAVRDRRKSEVHLENGKTIAAELRARDEHAQAAIVQFAAELSAQSSSTDLRSMEAVGMMILFGIGSICIGVLAVVLGAS